MAEKALVIVESPTKAKTITKFLGSNYIVRASNGHVRDLPDSATQIPAKLKKEGWARIGINVEKDFEPLYIVPPEKREHVKSLQEALAKVSILYLATDEDREGESISWHLHEVLKPKVPVKRLVFHEITKEAIEESIRTPREIDQNLVHAQETRRVIDRLFGYEVSPLLWKKMRPRLSAGRVQSVAIRLLVEREKARMRFKSAQYWGLLGEFEKGEKFQAELISLNDKRVATGKDFDPETGRLSSEDSVLILNEREAQDLRERLLKDVAKVLTVEEKPYTTRPYPPFVTSSLQQESNRKLRLSAKRTMQVAQQLYENGFITYMRTDSTTLSQQAISAARSFIQTEYGKEFLPTQPRLYATKVKNAQEAHEAIRPAGERFTAPEVVRAALGDEAFRLYDLIWKRTVASQMNDAKGTFITVTIGCAEAKFRATGKTIEFPGFLRAYVEGSDDPDSDLSDQERILPKMASGDTVKTAGIKAEPHETQPPSRFTEGSLIKELERLGIGRPSTWATIVELVLNRNYAFKKGNALVPTFTAIGVVNLLEKHFTNLLSYEFTASLEDDLDSISRGESEGPAYLKKFYFGNGHPGLKTLVKTGEDTIDPREVCGIPLGILSEGTPVEVRIGKYGAFLSDGTRRSSIPEEICPDELTVERASDLLTASAKSPESLGAHPESGEPVYVKIGRFGPYVQLGEAQGEIKPKMASLLKGMTPESVTLDEAAKLLSLPLTLGVNPENNEPIVSANGRFGPYIKCGTDTRSIPADLANPITITLDQAITLLKAPKAERGGRGRKPEPLKEIGEHPVSKKTVAVFTGRYGPYVTDGEINASLPRGKNPMELTMEESVQLLIDRAAKIEADGGVKKKKKAPAKKAAPKKEGAKKAPAKKKKAADS